MQEKIKINLVAIDLDGTLLDDSMRIPASTVDTIQRVSAQGAKVVLASARPVCAIVPYAEQLKLKTPIIALSGACIVESDGVTSLREQPFATNTYRRFTAQLSGKPYYLKVYGKSRLYVREALAETLKYAEGFAVPYTETGVQGLAAVQESIFRGFICGLSFDQQQAVKKMLEKEFTDLSIKWSEGTGLEILRQGVSKGEAVAYVGEQLGIPLTQTMAIGNETSDISMIEAARLGIAMGNSCEALKAVADEITRDNLHCGVEYILNKYL